MTGVQTCALPISGLKLLKRPLVFVFEVFETGVELDAVDNCFPVAEGLVSDPMA